jgi:hypothetical protein
MESEAGLYDFDSTRFLRANRFPASGRARGHASRENALDDAAARLSVVPAKSRTGGFEGNEFGPAFRFPRRRFHVMKAAPSPD